MPDFDFTVLGVKPVHQGITPLLEFELRVDNRPATEPVKAVLLHTQIQIEAPKRPYSESEKEHLRDLFGTPDRWGQTLRTLLWTHADLAVPPFTGSTTVLLAVPCTFDLEVASAKYFYALEEGEVSLLFLFSGTVFFEAPDGRLQVSRISWNKESTFQMPVPAWKEAIEAHYPGSATLLLDREVFDRLYAFKRQNSIPTWEEAIARLLDGQREAAALP